MGKYREREAPQAAGAKLDTNVKEAAGTGTDPTEPLAKLADLEQQGPITDEFG